MDLFDLLQQADINQLSEEVERARRQSERSDDRLFRQLAEENLDLKLRLGLLVRLLIAKGVFRAEELAELIASARRNQ